MAELTEEFTDDDLERGRWLFTQNCSFVKGCVSVETLPFEAQPEIAFAGRSNVGKSSLINAITNHTKLVRTSNTPGRTQEINYFNLDEHLYLVDLPGFGFAKAPKDKVDEWNDFVKTYLKGRSTLERVFFLIDSRHGIKKVDEEIMSILDTAAVSYQIILTKTDKISAKALEKCIQETFDKIKKRPAAYPFRLTTSSDKKRGLEQLRASIARLLANRN